MKNLETKKNTSVLDIKKFLSNSKFIYFNKNINHFETIGPENDIMLQEIKTLSQLLRYSSDCRQYHSKINFKNIQFCYYDNCLLNYLKEYLANSGHFNHYDTCWVKKAEKNIYVKRFDLENLSPETVTKQNIVDFLMQDASNKKVKYILNNQTIKNSLKITKSGWIIAKGDHSLTYSIIIKIRKLLKRFLHEIRLRESKDRIVDIYYSILKNGWDQKLAWLSNGSVIGINKDNGKFFSFTGRHRVVAASLAQNKFEYKIKNIYLPIIKVPNKFVIGNEPYPGEKG